MKLTSPILFLQILALTFALLLGPRVYAEAPRQDLVHAYVLLKHANHNYQGHRAKAMDHIEAAGKALNLRLEGDVNDHERQWKSDQMLAESRQLLFHARDSFERHDRDVAAAHLDKAIEEIDRALGREPARQVYPEPYRR